MSTCSVANASIGTVTVMVTSALRSEACLEPRVMVLTSKDTVQPPGGALALIRKLSAPFPLLVTVTVVVRDVPGSMLDIMLWGMDTVAPLVCPRVMRNSTSQAIVPPSRP